MRRTAIAGTFTLALTLGACATKQPAPPPLKLVTETEPTAAAPAPPTPEHILTEQPPEVQEAVQKHNNKRQVAHLQDTGLHALSVQPGLSRSSIAHRCGPRTFSSSRVRPSPTCSGRQRALDCDARVLRRPAQPCAASRYETRLRASRPTSRSTRRSNLPHGCSARAKPRDAGGRVLLPRPADDGEEKCRL